MLLKLMKCLTTMFRVDVAVDVFKRRFKNENLV